MPFNDSNVPFAKHNLHLNTQIKLNPPKEQRVQKLQAAHSTLQMQNNWTHKEENKRGRQPVVAVAVSRRWAKGCTNITPGMQSPRHPWGPSGRCQGSQLPPAPTVLLFFSTRAHFSTWSTLAELQCPQTPSSPASTCLAPVNLGTSGRAAWLIWQIEGKAWRGMGIG